MKRPIGQRLVRAWREIQGKRSSDYKGADMTRLLLDWVAKALTPDEEIKGSIRKLRARARELSRNEGYGKQYLRLLTTNVIGPQGFDMRAQVMKSENLDTVTNSAIELAWWHWSTGKVTVDGRLTLRRLQKVLLRAVARDGEVFVRRWRSFEGNPFGYALQAIDADMLDETYNRARGYGRNEIRMGVEVDNLGRPVGYHFFKVPENRVMDVGDAGRTFVPADQILHLYDPDRPNQTRGVTWFHPIMVPMKMLGGYEEAELVAARTAAAKMGFILSADGSSDPDSDQPAEMEASPGVLERLDAGETFAPWDPQHPSTAFSIFVKSILRKISSGLGVSYNALANDLEGVSYSSMRSGLLIERDHWKDLQEDWVEDFLKPVFEDWLNMALLTGALVLDSMDARRYAADVVWKPRRWQWVDPQKDVAATENAIALGLTSRTKACAESGDDFDENLLNLEREMEAARKKGVPIQGKPTAAPPQPSPADLEDDAESEDDGQRTLLAGRF